MNDNQLAMNYLVMQNEHLAALPLQVPRDFKVCGVEGGTIVFEKGGHERRYSIPIHEGAACKIEKVFIKHLPDSDELEQVSIVSMQLEGPYIAKIEVESWKNGHLVLYYFEKRQ